MGEAEVDLVAEPRTNESTLADRALAVLDANWLGAGTSPSRQLYPHQWSWDSACIAMGQAPWKQDRAETELRSLFSGQWGDGLLPHIVFTKGARYFPGPEFWGTERAAAAPVVPATSGIVQPPIHATAVLEVYRRGADRHAPRHFSPRCRRSSPPGTTTSARAATARLELVEIWHPWDSGMDNSPLWDPRSVDQATSSEVPDYRESTSRSPIVGAPVVRGVRPVRVSRPLTGARVRADLIRDPTPFALRPVLFNALSSWPTRTSQRSHGSPAPIRSRSASARDNG